MRSTLVVSECFSLSAGHSRLLGRGPKRPSQSKSAAEIVSGDTKVYLSLKSGTGDL